MCVTSVVIERVEENRNITLCSIPLDVNALRAKGGLRYAPSTR